MHTLLSDAVIDIQDDQTYEQALDDWPQSLEFQVDVNESEHRRHGRQGAKTASEAEERVALIQSNYSSHESKFEQAQSDAKKAFQIIQSSETNFEDEIGPGKIFKGQTAAKYYEGGYGQIKYTDTSTEQVGFFKENKFQSGRFVVNLPDGTFADILGELGEKSMHGGRFIDWKANKFILLGEFEVYPPFHVIGVLINQRTKKKIYSGEFRSLGQMTVGLGQLYQQDIMIFSGRIAIGKGSVEYGRLRLIEQKYEWYEGKILEHTTAHGKGLAFNSDGEKYAVDWSEGRIIEEHTEW